MINDTSHESVDVADPEAANSICEHRVVIRLNDGTLIKGVIRAQVLSPSPVAMPSLPTVLTVRNDTAETFATVKLADVKAVFFVRSYSGDDAYQEVQFFRQRIPQFVWVQLRLADGEALEGRIENSVRLLSDAGFWLWPADGIANNRLAYIPRDSVVEFHVAGVGAGQSGRTELTQPTGMPAFVDGVQID